LCPGAPLGATFLASYCTTLLGEGKHLAALVFVEVTPAGDLVQRAKAAHAVTSVGMHGAHVDAG
jgi:hypothetical protein